MAVKLVSVDMKSEQTWVQGNPPEPGPIHQHYVALGDDGNVYHRWWDGQQWGPGPKSTDWELVGHP